MAFHEREADRVRAIMKRRKGFSERKMFGGIAFMIDGHMCCGVVNDDLVLRLGNDGSAEALTSPHVRPMDFTGKPMKSMVYIAPKGYSTDAALRAWVEKAVAFTRSLPDR